MQPFQVEVDNVLEKVDALLAHMGKRGTMGPSAHASIASNIRQNIASLVRQQLLALRQEFMDTMRDQACVDQENADRAQG